MSDLPEPDDATFRLATGEELVVPGNGPAPDRGDARAVRRLADRLPDPTGSLPRHGIGAPPAACGPGRCVAWYVTWSRGRCSRSRCCSTSACG
ncbi:MAG: hypothetical protein R2695_16995 [Acidimicrobiales bacterium]